MIKFYLKLICCFILLCSCNSLFAQSTLQGKVTDANGGALSAVTVFIPELEKGTGTDKNGFFHFDNIGKGIIRLQFSRVGFQTQIKSVDMSHYNGDLPIQLEASSVPIEEVVVTSNQTELAKNIPYAVTSVSSEELQESGAPTITETLAQQPGVDIISGGSGIGKPVIRGLSFNRIVMYSMGTRVENQQWDDDHDAGISGNGIENVEIVYGPSALIYGADALGGAMIFKDEKPAPSGKTLGNVNLGLYSNTLGINSGVTVKRTDSSGFFYVANLNNQSHADFIQGKKSDEDPAHRFATNSRYDNFSGKAKIGVSRKWGISKLSYSYLHSLTGIIVDEEEDSLASASGEPFGTRNRRIMAPHQDVGIHIISLENTFLSGSSKWNVNAAYQVNNRKEFEPVPPGEPKFTAMGLLLHTFTYDVKWSSNEEKKLGVTGGTQGMVQTNKNFGNNIAVPDADVNDFAAYSLLHYNTNRCNFLGGVRFDIRSIQIRETNGVHEGEATLDSFEQAALDTSGLKSPLSAFKKYYYPASFSLGAVYHPVKDVTVKTNVATGFSAPNYAELSTFGKHEGTHRFETGNADLKAEQNIETDLSMIWEHKDFSLNVSGFYNHIKDYIYLSPTDKFIYDLQVIAFTQDNANIYGGSGGIEIHPTSLKWIEVGSAVSLISGKLSGGGNLPYIPANKIINEVEFESEKIGKFVNPYLSIVMNNYFSQNHPALYEERTKGYTLFDVSIGVDFNIGKQLAHASLFCTNVFNTAYFNHLSFIKDIGIYERGRNIGLKLRVPFGN